eukprot:scaffold692_cov181-Chaetoceros_neogracile.AAC.6
MMDRIVPVKPDIDEKREEQIDYEQKQQKQKPTLTSAALQSRANGTLQISSPTTGTKSSTKHINSNARVNGHHDVDDDDGGDDDIDNNVVDGHDVVEKQEQISPQRTSSRKKKGRILSYAEEELEPEISHSEDDGGVTFASTTGFTTTATINTTPVKVFVLGPCTLTGEGVGTGLGTHMHAEPHEHAERKMDNIGLFHWCSEVRIGYKKREQGLEGIASNGVEITVDREALLRSIGFDLVLPVSTDKKPTRGFADRIESTKRYKEKHGHLNPRRSDGDDESKALYNFFRDVRCSYRKRLHKHQPKIEKFKLTDYKYDALNAVGFPFKIIFPISSIEPEGKPSPSQAAKSKVKSSLPTKAKDKPTEDAEISLRKMDNTVFIQNVEAYKAFINEHGIRPSNSTNTKLSKWYNNLCRACKMRRDNILGKSPIVLTDERLSILKAAGINIIPLQTLDRTADSADALFMANVEKYKAFREVHGRAPYIHENSGLFHWCSEVRIGYCKKREQGLKVIASNGVEITVGREALLRSIGFDLVLPVSTDKKPTRGFADRIESTKRYKEKHGHLNPRRSDGDDESIALYNFFRDVRCSYRKRLHEHQPKNERFRLTEYRYDALNAVGFPFEIVYPFSPIEPKSKPSPSRAAKPKLKPRVPTKHKHIPTPSQPATSKHAMIAESTSPSNRHSRIKRKP